VKLLQQQACDISASSLYISALEVISFNEMRYINLRFTLLTYLLTSLNSSLVTQVSSVVTVCVTKRPLRFTQVFPILLNQPSSTDFRETLPHDAALAAVELLSEFFTVLHRRN